MKTKTNHGASIDLPEPVNQFKRGERVSLAVDFAFSNGMIERKRVVAKVKNPEEHQGTILVRLPNHRLLFVAPSELTRIQC